MLGTRSLVIAAALGLLGAPVRGLSIRFSPMDGDAGEAAPVGSSAAVPDRSARRSDAPPEPQAVRQAPREGRAEEPRIALRETVFNTTVSGDESRTFRDAGGGYRSDATVTYDTADATGRRVLGLLAIRATDDREIHADGNKLRLEGQFLELSRDGRYRMRAGDVVPEFSRYSLAHVGQGAMVSRDLSWSGGVGRVSAVHARLERERSPVVFRRWATGARAGHTWNPGGRGTVTLGGSYVDVRDVEGSISEAPLVAATPRDDILEADAVYEHPKGLRAEAEIARSRSTVSLAGASTSRRGRARRELVSYSRPRGSLVLEHERVDPTFDSPASFASVDLDRQAASGFWTMLDQVRLDANWVRVYSDITHSLGRGLESEAVTGVLTVQPFLKVERETLQGLSVSWLSRHAVDGSTDATTDRSTHEDVVTLSHRYRRLGASASCRGAESVDAATAANSRRFRNVTLQASYDLPGAAGRWRATPFVTFGRDRDRAVVAGVLDRGRSGSVGVDGMIGARHQFRAALYGSLQRLAAPARRSQLDTWQLDWTWRPHERRDLSLTMQCSSQENDDSMLGSVEDDRVLLSLYGRW